MTREGARSYSPEVLKRLQNTELEILDVISDLCKKHDIVWFLEGGSALGAARHGGFIPWDDDIDIAMPESEYNRFISIAKEELPSEYVLHTPGESDYYSATFAKICKAGTRFWNRETMDAGFNQGIFIDIFPYYAVSKDPVQRKRQFAGATKYTRMLYLYQTGRLAYPTKGVSGVFIRAGFRISHFILAHSTNTAALHAKFQQSIRCPKGCESDMSAIFSYPADGPEKNSNIVPPVKIEFEGRMLPVPKEYKAHLEWMFGKDWTKLPPESNRKSHAPIVLDFGDGLNALEKR